MAKRKQPKTYATTMDGKKVRVTVPESASVESLIDMVKEHLSPQAVAAIIAYLQPAKTKDAKINREIEWFSEKLVEAVGGNAGLVVRMKDGSEFQV